MTKPLILVTGATGYIASRLIPRLLDSGYRVRALARDPRRLKGRAWFDQIDIVQADVMAPETLPRLSTASTLPTTSSTTCRRDTATPPSNWKSARAFASAAEEAGVEHIIYLGGLADPEQHIAPHMRSRIETGKVLRAGQSAWSRNSARASSPVSGSISVRNDPLHDRVVPASCLVPRG
ncbi:MAG: NAD(P)H-binding protein [Candidatus Moduliflexus flocculans]|nr:NAD(P)H-binding protein [Candidatus Moduliflexus flocculans]